MTHELTTKSLEKHEKMAMMKDYEEEIRLENLKRKSEGGKIGAEITNNGMPCVQMDTSRNKKKRDFSTNTREQLKKLTGLSGGDIARWGYVEKHGDEETIKKMKTGEKIAMLEDFKEEVRIENEKKKLSTLKQNMKVSNRSLQMERTDNTKSTLTDTRTDAQIAKKAGVGVGTVAHSTNLWHELLP